MRIIRRHDQGVYMGPQAVCDSYDIGHNCQFP